MQGKTSSIFIAQNFGFLESSRSFLVGMSGSRKVTTSGFDFVTFENRKRGVVPKEGKVRDKRYESRSHGRSLPTPWLF